MDVATYLTDMWSLVLRGELQGVWFWAAVYAAVLCGYSVVYQLRIRRWPRATGRLNSAAIEKFGATAVHVSDQDYQAKTLYSYRIEDRSYTGHRISPWVMLASHNLRFLLHRQLAGIKGNPSGSIEVLYNPNHPEKSFLVAPGNAGILVTCVLASLPGITFIGKYYW